MERNREMERIYMKQLRDMESAVYFLTAKKAQYERDIYNLRLPYRNPEEPIKPEFDTGTVLENAIFIFIFRLIQAVICIDICSYLVWIFTDIFKNALEAIIFGSKIGFLIAIIFVIVKVVSEIKSFTFEKEEYQRVLANNKTICQNNESAYAINCSNADKKSAELVTINNELQRAKDILTEAYSINWIPNKYRDIRVVYYIADMVTTSDINMDEALKYYLLQEANNKLDEILQKLDEIIANQNEIICQQAIAQSQNEALISQNKKMISQFANIESNTKLAADYSAIGANYSAATAYFSLATYLKN